MSNPISSLKKSKKTGFTPGASGLYLAPVDASTSNHSKRQRTVPFKAKYSVDENKLLDEITTNMTTGRGGGQGSRSSRDGNIAPLPRLSDHSPRASKHSSAPGPSDGELMSVMMARLSQLENRITLQAKEIIEKDKQIKILQDKVKILQSAKGGNGNGNHGDNQKVRDLEKKCLMLQQNVHEMETFLADYGMVWVGDSSNPHSNTYLDSDEYEVALPDGDENSLDDNTLWTPESSLASKENYKPNFDVLVENLRDLNVLAGEGVAQIKHTTDGARLKMPDPIPLTLYANGIVMFSGPFRSFRDATTQECLQDITEGYFPSELQTRFPDGVPFAVTDKRNVYFKERRSAVAFRGAGQVLGGETKPSRLVPSNLNPDGRKVDKANDQEDEEKYEVETEIPGPKLSVEQFLKQLPSTVVKNGKVIDIRGSVGQSLQGKNEHVSAVTVVETVAVQEMKARLALDENSRPPSSRDITTLRIKSDEDDKTFILKMKFSETIGQLRSYLNKQRNKSTISYQIMSAFPNRTYDDDSATLQSCGLVPNAALHLRVAK